MNLKDLENFVPRLPTDEECKQDALQWMKPLRPHLLEAWPAEFHELSVKTTFVQIDARLLRDEDENNCTDYYDALVGKIDNAFNGQAKFIKLSSRSPKDYSDNLIIEDGEYAMECLSNSMRTFDDLCRFSHLQAPCFVCLREPIEGLTVDSEYRIFVCNGDIRAITYYNYNLDDIDPPTEAEEHLRKAINEWYSSKMQPHICARDFVFDVHINNLMKNPTSKDVLLIETNPYGLSDPCFFGNYSNIEKSNGKIQFNPYI